MDGTLFGTLVVIALVFGVLAFTIARVEGLAFLGPKRTRAITSSATAYCSDRCRAADGRCPLTGSADRFPSCPLWRFIEADEPTVRYGSPFAHLQRS